MCDFLYDINENIYVSNLDMFGKIIDRKDVKGSAMYIVVFDDGTWNTFFEFELFHLVV